MFKINQEFWLTANNQATFKFVRDATSIMKEFLNLKNCPMDNMHQNNSICTVISNSYGFWPNQEIIF